MSPTEHDHPERDGDDLLAAEYVMGVLPGEERQEVARRIEADAAFARLVDAWEVRLAPLGEAYPEAAAPDGVKAAIDRRLFASSAASAADAARGRAGLWSSLAFWRGLAAVAVAALAIAIVVPYVSPPAGQPALRLVASLAADSSDVKYLAVYDAAHHEVGLSHVAGERAAGKDFQLWMIEGKNAPVSMGVIPTGPTVHIELTPALQQKLAQGAVLAISVEPAGGSPTGQPTGPVVATGDLKSI
ncbi:anti-sigma factor [Mesorhizobium sp. CN5-321]|jgi:anti-sigma-K factor RskA|uniref:anti-sigma factor n=1 Tax=Mesorhizobium hunchu TaxID=3157708 RepID=UPI0032B8417D